MASKLKPGLFAGVAVLVLGILLITHALSLEVVVGVGFAVIGVMMILQNL